MTTLSQDQVLQVLKGAREIVSEPSRWVTGKFAVRADGSEVTPQSPDAIRFCVRGAIVRSLSDLGLDRDGARDETVSRERQVSAAMSSVVTGKSLGRESDRANWLGHWNNNNPYEAIVAGFDQTIAHLQATSA